MNYRSINDLNADILKNAHRIPTDVDLIVGIPRSGLLAANILALLGNYRLTDLDSYLDGRLYTPGTTKASGMRDPSLGPRKVLVIDDSITSGRAMKEARRRIAEAKKSDTVLFAAVYGTREDHPEADIVFEAVPQPRLFQWNFMHHVILAQSCVDIDGVLCHDPSEDENDDGTKYTEFLLHARSLYNFTHPVGTLVTSRLEKYRPQTESWLKKVGFKYEKLVMLDLPSKEERQRLSAHGSFKAEYYRSSDAVLFVESENKQARYIAQHSGKPVLCLQTHRLIEPSVGRILTEIWEGTSGRGRADAAKRALRATLGHSRYERFKSLLRRG